MPNVLSRVNKENLLNLLQQWLFIQIPLAEFLEDQWEAGMYLCGENAMMVPPRYRAPVFL